MVTYTVRERQISLPIGLPLAIAVRWRNQHISSYVLRLYIFDCSLQTAYLVGPAESLSHEQLSKHRPIRLPMFETSEREALCDAWKALKAVFDDSAGRDHDAPPIVVWGL